MPQLEQERKTALDGPRPRRRKRTTNTKLLALRVNEGLSANDLGRIAGVSGQVVRMAEAGYVPGPRIQFAIAGVFKDEAGQQLRPLDIWPLERQL